MFKRLFKKGNERKSIILSDEQKKAINAAIIKQRLEALYNKMDKQ